MKKRIIGAVIVALAIGVALNGYFYFQQSNRLRDAEAQVVTLQESLAALTDNVSALTGAASELTRGVSVLNADASALKEVVSTLKDDAASLKGDAAALKEGVSGLTAEAGRLSANVSALRDSLNGLSSNVSANAGAFHAYASAGPDTAKKLAPVMVMVDVSGFNFQASGSGTIISKKGYILTAEHVISKGQSIKVTTMDGAEYGANVVGSDPEIDLALLRIASDSELPEVVLGSPAEVIVGREVLAIGFALGSNFAGSPTVTRGIISAVRTFQGSRYIQTDAAINPGNSGGCLVTLDGKMIGVPTATVRSADVQIQLIGLAIPIDEIQAFIQRMLGP